MKYLYLSLYIYKNEFRECLVQKDFELIGVKRALEEEQSRRAQMGSTLMSKTMGSVMQALPAAAAARRASMMPVGMTEQEAAAPNQCVSGVMRLVCGKRETCVFGWVACVCLCLFVSLYHNNHMNR